MSGWVGWGWGDESYKLKHKPQVSGVGDGGELYELCEVGG